MKGLLLKDIYVMSKYCKVFGFIILLFLALSLFSEPEMFYVMYPAIIASVIPVSMISVDEKCKWDVYCDTLPYSRKQMVSSKYLLSLCMTATVLILSACAQMIHVVRGNWNTESYVMCLAFLLVIGLVGPAVLLPFIFKMGAEKGRVVYLAVIAGLAACGSGIALGEEIQGKINVIWLLPGCCIVSILLFAVSWMASIKFYEKREL